jgi:hypothetical protein
MKKRVYKTMQGREIDMDSLLAKHETMPAVGNVRMNARGDELGPGGKVIRTREEVVSEYYEDNPNAQPARTVKVEPVVKKVQDTKKKNVNS